MSTFIGQLVGFAVIVFFAWKFVVPTVRKLMADRQTAISTQLAESADASARVAQADAAHAKALEDAKAEAARITEEARVDSRRIVEQLRAQADSEVERIKVQGAQQVDLLRHQLIRDLRQSLGTESVQRAGELVREHVSDPAAQSATVDRFLDELDAMAPSAAVIADPLVAKLRAASRDSLSALVARFEGLAEGLAPTELTGLADELTAGVKLFVAEPALGKHLAEPAEDPAAKVQLLRRLIAGKVGEPALALLTTAVSARWSAAADMLEAVKHIAQLALLVQAERTGSAGEVEDELFRFGRVLDSEVELNRLLGEYDNPAAGRIALLERVLGGSANPTASALLTQTVELAHGDRVDEAVAELAQLAVARRGEVVAHVRAAAALSEIQRARLTEILTRVYGHPVAIQLHVDPQILGGLSIAVGEEVVDGTLSTRLTAAANQLPE